MTFKKGQLRRFAGAGETQALLLTVLASGPMLQSDLARAMCASGGSFSATILSLKRVRKVETETLLDGRILVSLVRPPTPEEIEHEKAVAAGWEELRAQLDTPKFGHGPGGGKRR